MIQPGDHIADQTLSASIDNQLTLELFNDSQLGVVSSSAPGTPLDIQAALKNGGFTGQLTTKGGRAVFTTPGGAEITILGTNFLIAYDPVTRVTTAGNFHGTVQVASAGVQVALASGSAVVVPADQPPGAQFPVTFTLAQFQQQARALTSRSNALFNSLTIACARLIIRALFCYDTPWVERDTKVHARCSSELVALNLIRSMAKRAIGEPSASVKARS